MAVIPPEGMPYPKDKYYTPKNKDLAKEGEAKGKAGKGVEDKVSGNENGLQTSMTVFASRFHK